MDVHKRNEHAGKKCGYDIECWARLVEEVSRRIIEMNLYWSGAS